MELIRFSFNPALSVEHYAYVPCVRPGLVSCVCAIFTFPNLRSRPNRASLSQRRGRQLPTPSLHLAAVLQGLRVRFCTEVPSPTTCSVLHPAFPTSPIAVAASQVLCLSSRMIPNSSGLRRVTERLRTILASARVDGNYLSKTFSGRFIHFWERSRQLPPRYPEL